jgi:plasmid stabilization system protein ParE
MAFRVEISLQAEHDAEGILDWLLLQKSGEAGIHWFLALDDAFASLAQFPERCPIAPENPRFPFEVRQLFYGRKPHVYRILFTVNGDMVQVLHIRHGRRKPLTPST